MELPQAVAEVLHEAIPEADQFTQYLGRPVGQPRRGRPLLRGEAGDPERVDGVGLRPPQVLPREPVGPQRVQQGDGEAAGHQGGKEVLPVMARRFHGHQRVSRGAEAVEQLLVPLGVLGEGRRLEAHGPGLVHSRHDVLLGRHVDPDEAHARPFRRAGSGASEPVLMPTLVHARTPAAPQDTVRVLSTGRGRQSQARGQRLSHATATLSRIPSLVSRGYHPWLCG
jgi:hypothetical protein